MALAFSRVNLSISRILSNKHSFLAITLRCCFRFMSVLNHVMQLKPLPRPAAAFPGSSLVLFPGHRQADQRASSHLHPPNPSPLAPNVSLNKSTSTATWLSQSAQFPTVPHYRPQVRLRDCDLRRAPIGPCAGRSGKPPRPICRNV